MWIAGVVPPTTSSKIGEKSQNKEGGKNKTHQALELEGAERKIEMQMFSPV